MAGLSGFHSIPWAKPRKLSPLFFIPAVVHPRLLPQPDSSTMSKEIDWQDCIAFIEARIFAAKRGRRDPLRPEEVFLSTLLRAALRVLKCCWTFEQSLTGFSSEEVLICPWCRKEYTPQFPNFTSCSSECTTFKNRYPPIPEWQALEEQARRCLEALDRAQS